MYDTLLLLLLLLPFTGGDLSLFLCLDFLVELQIMNTTVVLFNRPNKSVKNTYTPLRLVHCSLNARSADRLELHLQAFKIFMLVRGERYYK